MPKEETLKLEGTIVEVLPNAMFRIQVKEMDHVMIAVISGKMRQHNIKCLLGDRVELECSLYDLSRGRITRRN